MEAKTEGRPPGLRVQGGRLLWRASKEAVKKGYPVKSANLTMHAGNDAMIRAQCERLQGEMLAWLSGSVNRSTEFNGTFKSIFDLYENDPRSPYHKLKPRTRQPYSVYLNMMRVEIGHCHIDKSDGRDVQDWFDSWKAPAKKGGKLLLAKAHMSISVLKAALAYAIMCRKPGCADFRMAMPKRLQAIPPRKFALVASQIDALRQAAHEIQRPTAALAYALQFEGAIRQIDVIGQWVPLSDPRPSAIHYRGKKWLGPTWEKNVDKNLIFKFKPTKTEDTSEEEVSLDLRACPMVMEELEMTLDSGRLSGPLIIDRGTGRPFSVSKYTRTWRACATIAKIPRAVWNRDLRKSGSTEARAAGAPVDDVKKLMGHTEETDTTEKVYDLAHLEAHRRIAAARKAHRSKK
jgi:integrase